MVGHDNVGGQLVALAVEVMEGIGDNPCVLRSAKEARSVTGIQPFLHLFSKSLVVSRFGGGVPWFWMKSQPSIPFFLPFCEFALRERVGLTPSERDPRVILLPMGEIVTVFFDISVRVKEWLHVGSMWRGAL